MISARARGDAVIENLGGAIHFHAASPLDREAKNMPGYRCFFFGIDNHILSRFDFEAESDVLAIIEARAQYAESEFRNGFEVLERSRLVYQENRVPQRP